MTRPALSLVTVQHISGQMNIVSYTSVPVKFSCPDNLLLLCCTHTKKKPKKTQKNSPKNKKKKIKKIQ